MGEQGHEEPTGQAKITKAYNLPCRYVLPLCPAYRRSYCAGKADGETLRIASVLLLVLSGTGIGIRAGKCGILLYIHWGILLSEGQGGADCRTDGTGVFGGDS